MRGSLFVTVLVATLLALTVLPAQAEDPAIEAVVDVLRQRGLIDEAEAARIVSLNRGYEKKNEEAWYDRISFYGDYRGRYQGEWYDDSKVEFNDYDRHRLRYRLRLGAEARINEYLRLDIRLASAEGQSPRTRNQTLGRGRNFDPDGFWIEYAYLDLEPFRNLDETVSGGAFAVQFGKVKNPFRWKKTKDWMLWDADITPEGVAFLFEAEPNASVDLFANAGYFIIRENAGEADPHLFGLQVGGEAKVSDTVAVGGRASWYAFHSMKVATLANFDLAGNVGDGLTGSPSADGGFDVGQLSAYARYEGFADWPVTAFADVARNFDASGSALHPTLDGGEDTAWGVGVEVGDKKRWASLGIGFWHIETNVFPGQFVDSDFLSTTNREGWALWGKRRVLPNMDAGLTLYFGRDVIDDDLPALTQSVIQADRVRLDADIEVFF